MYGEEVKMTVSRCETEVKEDDLALRMSQLTLEEGQMPELVYTLLPETRISVISLLSEEKKTADKGEYRMKVEGDPIEMGEVTEK